MNQNFQKKQEQRLKSNIDAAKKNKEDFGNTKAKKSESKTPQVLQNLLQLLVKKEDNEVYTTQDSLPYDKIFQDGIMKLDEGRYNKCIEFTDINYRLAKPEDQRKIFDDYCKFLNYFDSTIDFQLTFLNLTGFAAYPLNSLAVSMPFTNKPYVAGVGGLLTALFMGIFIAWTERQIRKFMPNALDTFLTPLCTLIFCGLISVVFLQPVGGWLTNIIYVAMDFLYDKLSWFGGYILSSTFLALVSVGLHQALTPIHVMLNDPTGPTHGINYLLPILMMAGGGQVGAGFALWLKSKNKRFKNMVMSSIPVAILGVGEPLMYAVTLPLGRPFITACLGAGFGGVAASLFHLGTVSQGVSGLFGLLIMQPGQQVEFLIALLISYVGGFVLTWFFGIDEARINEVFPE